MAMWERLSAGKSRGKMPRYRTLTDRVYNPRWFEYHLFFAGIELFVVSKNWNEPW